MSRCLAPLVLLAVFAFGCADPCADVVGEPNLTIATSNADGTSFELFDDGAELPLNSGAQIGMHVWLQLRFEGLCQEQLRVERRVVHVASGEPLAVQRAPLRFVDGSTDGSFELRRPLTMIICPSDQAILDQPLRFEVTAEDADGRTATAVKGFTPICAPPGACDICAP